MMNTTTHNSRRELVAAASEQAAEERAFLAAYIELPDDVRKRHARESAETLPTRY